MSKIEDSVTREVLLLPLKTVFESTGMCGSSGTVQLTYEHFPYVFQVEIDNRRNIGRYFMETELWYLLYTLIRAGSKFEKYHAKIGDVHPTNILINNDGLVKVISTCSLPREETNFDKLVENSSSRVFLGNFRTIQPPKKWNSMQSNAQSIRRTSIQPLRSATASE
jgi:hypothetical protein